MQKPSHRVRIFYQNISLMKLYCVSLFECWKPLHILATKKSGIKFLCEVCTPQSTVFGCLDRGKNIECVTHVDGYRSHCSPWWYKGLCLVLQGVYGFPLSFFLFICTVNEYQISFNTKTHQRKKSDKERMYRRQVKIRQIECYCFFSSNR